MPSLLLSAALHDVSSVLNWGVWSTIGLLSVTLLLIVILCIRHHRRTVELNELATKLAQTEREQEILQVVVESARDGLILQEMDATIVWANPAYCQIMGRDLEEMIGRKPHEFVFPEHQKWSQDQIDSFRFDPDSERFQTLERRLNVRKNGEEFWHEFNLSLVEPSPGDQKVVIVSRDVSKAVAQEEELAAVRHDLQFAARHDSLTGLVNRTEFVRKLDEFLAAPDVQSVGVLQLDLDKFKAINDTRGHEAGDAVLQHVAGAINSVVRSQDVACRLGGDEFVIACPNVHDFAELRDIAGRLLDAISDPFDWRGEQIQAEASVGISACAHCRTTSKDLTRFADFALYEAKAADRPRIACYDAILHQRKEAEAALVSEFSRAIDKGDLTFAYQPIVAGRNGQCIGFETLARWTSSSGIPVPPLRFIEFAQRLRRKNEIDLAAMRAAIEMAARAAEHGHKLRATFNASTETLMRPDFVVELEWETDRVNLNRDCITVEVLETTFFGQDTSRNEAAQTITDLRKAGFGVMLDDFGVGYAGLSHLDKLDISGIKIDRSLVISATEVRSSRLIVDALLTLAKDLGLIALAEGIETQDQAQQFVEAGCELMQGYAFGRPMSADAFLEFLKANPQQRDHGPEHSSVA